jgi:hypothetical protein
MSILKIPDHACQCPFAIAFPFLREMAFSRHFCRVRRFSSVFSHSQSVFALEKPYSFDICCRLQSSPCMPINGPYR